MVCKVAVTDRVKLPLLHGARRTPPMVVKFQITLDEGVDENAYQILRCVKKVFMESAISKCVVIERGNRSEIAGDPDETARATYISRSWPLSGYYLDGTCATSKVSSQILSLESLYEARYRDTHLPVCEQNRPAPDRVV